MSSTSLENFKVAPALVAEPRPVDARQAYKIEPVAPTDDESVTG